MNAALDAVCAQALAATGARSGWVLVATDDTTLRVAAVAGEATATLGTEVAAVGARAYVRSAGQAAVLRPPIGDRTNDGAGGMPGVPAALLAVPCGDDAVGVLEVVDPASGESFGFDDLEALTMLGAVAGAVLDEREDTRPVPSPDELASGLRQLATQAPMRYRHVAGAVEALLGQG